MLELDVGALQNILQQQGLTYYRLSKKLGKSISYMGTMVRKARKGRPMTLSTAQQIAKALGVDVTKITKKYQPTREAT